MRSVLKWFQVQGFTLLPEQVTNHIMVDGERLPDPASPTLLKVEPMTRIARTFAPSAEHGVKSIVLAD